MSETTQKQSDLFGTDPHKLHRKDAPGTSIEAAHTVDTTSLEQMVYEAIEDRGAYGCIAQDLLNQFSHKPYSSITARFKALEDKKLIFYRGDKRKGASGRNQRVMRSIEYKQP